MKTVTITLLFALLPVVMAAKGPGSGPNGGQMGRPMNRGAMQGPISQESAKQVSQSGMSTLYQFLSLDEDALEQLEATIHRIRQMSPEERAAYKKKILEYQEMPPEKRQNIQQAWGRLDSTVRAAWRTYMMSLDADEHARIRKELQSVAPESRTEWRIGILKEAGYLKDDASGEKQ